MQVLVKLRIEPENLDEIKTSLRKEILSDLSKILAENQKQMLKLITPSCEKRLICTNDQHSGSEPENTSIARTSTPVKTTIATSSKTTPVNKRKKRVPVFRFFGTVGLFLKFSPFRLYLSLKYSADLRRSHLVFNNF